MIIQEKLINNIEFYKYSYQSYSLIYTQARVMFQNQNKGNRQHSILDTLEKLKQSLMESNNISIGNLHCLTVNLQFIISYAVDAIKVMIYTIQKLKAKNQEYINIIASNGLQQLIKVDMEEEYQTVNLQKLNDKIDHFIQQKRAAMRGMSNRGRANKRNGNKFDSKERIHQKSVKNQMRYQYNLAKNFVNAQLQYQLIEDESKEIQIPKNVFINSFVSWNEKSLEKIEFTNLSLIQMAITNQLKTIFPNLSHNQKYFKGIKFKDNNKNFSFSTDVFSRQSFHELQDDMEQTPPLPVFEDDHLAEDQ